MRSDMDKVIIERPRLGGNQRNPKGRIIQTYRMDPDLAPQKEPIKTRGRSRKSLNENLRPLENFLIRQAGRPWNDVFSEICRTIPGDSTVQAHVRNHVWDMVATQVEMRKGEPYNIGRWFGRTRPLNGRSFEKLFVHPDTGILTYVQRRKEKRKKAPIDRIEVNEFVQLQRIHGIWYEVRFAKRPQASAMWDAVLKRRIWTSVLSTSLTDMFDLLENHGRVDMYAVSKKQLSKKEIRDRVLNR